MAPVSSSSAAPEQVLFDVSNFPKAAEFLDAALSGKYRIICYGGAIRGGKTFSALGTLILLHRRWAHSRSVIVRDSFTTLVRNVLPSVAKAFPTNFIHPRHKATHSWRFRNESYCQLVSENAAQDPELKNWNGLEYNFCILEQAEELQEATFIKAIERLGSYMVPAGAEQPPPLLMLTVNPTDTWARKWFYEPWLKGELPEGWLYIPARIDDNPHIAESYKESLLLMKAADPVHYDKFVSGNWDAKESTGNEFYPAFKRGQHVKPTAYLPGLPILQSWDANSLPYCAMLCAQQEAVAGGLRIRIFQEYALRSPNSGLGTTARKFLLDRAANSNQWASSDVLLTGDASLRKRNTGDGNQSDFKDVVANMLPALNSRSANLWPRFNTRVMASRDFVNLVLRGGLPGVTVQIDEACVELIADMELSQLGIDGIFKEMYNDKELGVRYQLRGHFADIVRYLFVTLLEAEYKAFLAVREG